MSAMHDHGRVLHLGQVVIDLTMYIPRLPDRGGDMFADSSGISAGGGYNVLYAARQMGSEALYLGGMGQGNMADIAQAALENIGVDALGPMIEGVDLGYCVAMTEADGERTFVSTRGAETMVPEDSYLGTEFAPGDVVYLSGYSLGHGPNKVALERLAHERGDELAGKVTTVFDVGPLADTLELESLAMINELRPLWSVNEREGEILTRRWGLSGDSHAERCQALATYLGSPVILRAGPLGAWLSYGGPATHVLTLSVTPVDTNGAGDAHAGALCACVAQGVDLMRALVLANCAGALSTLRVGPATCPPKDEVEAAAASLVG